MIEIYPSLLSADFCNILPTLKDIEEHCNGVHWDIMDGHFAPNLSFGPHILKSVRKNTPLFYDVHLMVVHPLSFIESFIDAGAQRICFHIESKDDPHTVAECIKRGGCEVGVALNPSTSVDKVLNLLKSVDCLLIMSVNPGFSGQKFIPYTTKKIKQVKKLIEEKNIRCKIEVDGGIEEANIKEVAEAGADIVVCGSSVFGKGEPLKNLLKLKECLKRL